VNAIKRHQLPHAHVKLVLSHIFKPKVHGIKWSVRMLMLKRDKYLRLDLETLKNKRKRKLYKAFQRFHSEPMVWSGVE